MQISWTFSKLYMMQIKKIIIFYQYYPSYSPSISNRHQHIMQYINTQSRQNAGEQSMCWKDVEFGENFGKDTGMLNPTCPSCGSY